MFRIGRFILSIYGIMCFYAPASVRAKGVPPAHDTTCSIAFKRGKLVIDGYGLIIYNCFKG